MMQEKEDRSIGMRFRVPIKVKRANPKASATSSESRGGVKNRP